MIVHTNEEKPLVMMSIVEEHPKSLKTKSHVSMGTDQRQLESTSRHTYDNKDIAMSRPKIAYKQIARGMKRTNFRLGFNQEAFKRKVMNESLLI